MTRLPLLAAALIAASLAFGAPARAAGSDQQEVVDHAKVAIDDMYSDSSFGNAKSLIQRAKAVMIVPELVKGGFFVGGEGGSGVLLVKSGGTWSAPAFYTVGAASFGLQIGVETAEVVFFVMSDKALKAWMTNERASPSSSSAPTRRRRQPPMRMSTSSPGPSRRAPMPASPSRAR
jgi:lipid-binding SYLF domain-containing protein